MRTLFVLILFAAPVYAQFIPTVATLPLTTPVPTYPATIQTVKTVKASGGDYAGTGAGLQAAIDAVVTNRATWGNTGAIEIRIDEGLTLTKASAYTVNSCDVAVTTEIIIRTASNSMPAQGTRIKDTDYPNMPRVETTGVGIRVMDIGFPAVNGTVRACRIRLMGFELMKANGYSMSGNGQNLRIGEEGTSTTQDTAAEIPYGIWVDRMRIACDDLTQDCGKGIQFAAKDGGVVDSEVTGFKSMTNGDTNAIWIQNTTGNLLVKNNWLMAAGEVILSGGGSAPLGGEQYIVSDVTVSRNLMEMDPACPGTWQCKNLGEMKEGIRWLYEGNVYRHGRYDAQAGQGITIKVSSNGQNRPWVETGHITFRRNKEIDMDGYGFYVQGHVGGSAFGYPYVHHVTVEDNVVDGASNGNTTFPPAGGVQSVSCTAATGCPTAASRILSQIFFRHNTVIASARVNANTKGGFGMLDSTVITPNTRCTKEFAAHDNIFPLAREGATGTNSTVTNCKVDGVRVDAQSWSNDYDSFWGNLSTNAGASACTTPSLSLKPLAQNESGCTTTQGENFTSFNAANIGNDANNYTLKNTSPGYQTASDAAARTAAGLSTNVGADIAAVNTATCGTITGNWTTCSGQPAPTVSSITPNTGSYLGGTAVTNLAGTGFVSGATVTFGGVAGVNVVVVSSIKITVDTPANAAGAVDVKVTNPDLQNATLAVGFTYTGSGALTIATVAPATGSFLGGPMRITGTNFAQGATVLVGGQSCGSVAVVSTSLIYCSIPPNPVLGLVDVSVTNPGGSPVTAAGSFTYTNVILKGVFASP